MFEYFKLKFRKLRAEVLILETIAELILVVKDNENVVLLTKISQLLKSTPESEWVKVIVDGIKTAKNDAQEEKVDVQG
jgi:hypothetical protein